MRIVLDTNVLVSGLISRNGYPGGLPRLVQGGRVTLVTSEYQIAELRDVLFRDSLRRFIQPVEANDLIHHMATVAMVITELPEVALAPDPKDDAILATGIAGQVDMIVSGDKDDMLALGDAEGIPIVTPRKGFERLAHLLRTLTQIILLSSLLGDNLPCPPYQGGISYTTGRQDDASEAPLTRGVGGLGR